MEVSKDKFDFIKPKINKNKSLTTMIDYRGSTLNDANELIYEIGERKLVKIMPLKNRTIW